MKIKYFECDCWDFEHIMRFVYDKPDKVELKLPDGNTKEVYMWDDIYLETLLNDRNNFLKRLWIALRYIFKFNIPHAYGISISHERLDEFIEFLQDMRKEIRD